jgi:hypothetical protein
VGRWDVWDHADPLVVPLAYALDGRSLELFVELLEDTREELEVAFLEDGKAILRWLKAQHEQRLSRAFPVELGGLRCLAVNTDTKGSGAFEGATGYQAGLTFFRLAGAWKVGLYALAEGVDVGAVCSQLGGGGHRGAGGFSCADLPFSLP